MGDGAVPTDFSSVLWEDPEREKNAVASIRMGRISEPEDIAGLALLLASPAGRNRYCLGTCRPCKL
jgi:hypothetical protein